MKRLLLLVLLLTGFQGFSQTRGISYQAVILSPSDQELPGENAGGNILANTAVSIQFTIVNASAGEEFQEFHRTSTDGYGMINLLIGTGTSTGSSKFTDIVWDGMLKKLKVGIDFSGGTNFSPLSEQNLTYMPQPVNDQTAQAIASILVDQAILKQEVSEIELIRGEKGEVGPQGIQGEVGPQGIKGDTGEQGIQGIKGDQGDTGAQGLKGDTGTQGIQGEVGLQGFKGDKGDTGVQGIQGIAGPKGDTGEQGNQGIIGDQGDTGAQGLKGDTGAQGIKGDKGDTGLEGDTGAQGIQGDKGDTGLKGDTGAQGIQGDKGDTGLKGDMGAQGIKGDKGDTGAQGIQGEQGLKGDTGAQGIQGEQGLKGDTGAQGIQGEVGLIGDTGAQGIQGDKGDTGLKGDTGAQGIQGEVGLQGLKGDKGDTGAQGAQGVAGPKGDQGDTGTQGIQGVAGPAGDKGDKGDTGEAGPAGTTAGDMQYWNGTAWVIVPSTGSEGATLQLISGIPTWAGGTSPSATAPDAPTIGTATAGDTQATVAFTAPTINGGAAITTYTVTSIPDADETGRTATGTSSPITITGLTNGTAYTFTVTATNSVGTGAASAASNSVTPVAAATAPDAPTIGTATAGDTQATVTFTAPTINGGAAITTYTVTSIPDADETGGTATGTSSPITITGLTNGTAYTFTVTATNSVGTGAASAASNSVTPVAAATAPDAPTIGTATAGDAQASVEFTAPTSDGGAAITTYTVTSIPDADETGRTATGTSSPITITGLTNGTAYTFTVTATNSVGTGAASAASNSVMPVAAAPSVTTVTSTTTGKVWMDRNLGASQVATSSTDAAAYGDLYQWGRGTDGHQSRTSGTTIVQSSSTSPGTNFITESLKWYIGTNPDDLWQGVSGVNNPCPSGFRLPTGAEWEAEIVSWGTTNKNAAGAFASPLKLPLAGNRSKSGGSFSGVGTIGNYWSSSFQNINNSFILYFNSGAAVLDFNYRALGGSIRCFQDGGSTATSATAPAAPTIGTATAGDAQATVEFTAPTSDGGAAITTYTVTSIPDADETGGTATGTSSPITITGLTNGTAYTFTVTATNSVGTGAASAASNSVTPVAAATAPDAPTIVTATAGDAQVTVAFTAPASDGGAAISSYTVTSSPEGLTATGGTSPITVTGLTNGTAYTFSVTATNSVGTGAASGPFNSVTPVAAAPRAPSVTTVTNLTTGKVWMDRNLGATQVATSSTDAASYGDLYQWGRGTDGHQIRTPFTTTATKSSSDTPGHGDFITSSGDWRSSQNVNLWQGVDGINNPCPSGYRLPTETELDNERKSWTSNDPAGAFASPLKLPLTGFRSGSNGSLIGAGTFGFYWSSTVSSTTNSRYLRFNSSSADMNANGRANGLAVRCIQDGGSTSTSATVPDAPTIVTATAGDAQVTVAFTAPTSDGGSAITTYTVTSIPDADETGGTATGTSSPITITGLTNGTAYTFTVTATNSVGTGAASAASNSVTPVAAAPSVTTVTSSTGKIWMDRNLGAIQVATSSTDAASYGDLYQWGRGTDGHQIRTSGTTATLSTTDTPGNGNFILAPNSPNDWRSPQNDNLWQGVNGTNNPCPSGYRLPTETEWEAERVSWVPSDAAGAFASVLKLPVAGARAFNNGSLVSVGSIGLYWSSTVSSTNSGYLGFSSSSAPMGTQFRARGYSVRCIQDVGR